MRKLVIAAALLLGLAALWLGMTWIASESGEVVVLTTLDAAGQHRQTRLWVADTRGHAWLRAGSTRSSWYRRLLQHPQVEVERTGARRRYRAEPEPASQPEVNRLMLEKYGWAERWIGFSIPRRDALPIRLDPL